MLLVLTGSMDGTADLIFSKIGSNAFRFNHDIFSDYSVCLRPNFWSIENPAGLKIDNYSATHAFWWKAFSYFIDGEEYVAEEVKYVFREIYGTLSSRGLIKGNSPDFHRQYGKIQILQIADKHFIIPDTMCGWGNVIKQNNTFSQRSIVAKSLASGLTTTNKALFTSEVKLSTLDVRYPWYLQEKINAKSDVTAFVCGDKIFCFERDRSNLEGLDWRNQKNIFLEDQNWLPFELTKRQEQNIREFITQLKVDWGRLDFLWTGSDLMFLEFNANGQFVFLDYKNQYGILDSVVDYLMRAN